MTFYIISRALFLVLSDKCKSKFKYTLYHPKHIYKNALFSLKVAIYRLVRNYTFSQGICQWQSCNQLGINSRLRCLTHEPEIMQNVIALIVHLTIGTGRPFCCHRISCRLHNSQQENRHFPSVEMWKLSSTWTDCLQDRHHSGHSPLP